MTAQRRAELREHEAADLDTGRADVRPVLRRLGQVGCFGASGADPVDELLPSVRLVRELATASLAAAFAAWSQRMVIEYLRYRSPEPESEAGLEQALRTGEVTGASALAPAISDLAGRAELPVVAAPDGDGWRLSGRIGWASNLFDDAVVVTPARTPDEGRLVVLFRRTAPGVTPTPLHELLGLNGTGTGALELDGVWVGRGQVLSDDLADFMAVCRPAMLLQQSALAVGLADAALGQAAVQLTGLAAVLRSEHEELAGRRDEVAIRMEDQAGSRVGIAPGDLARLRLDAMNIAARAVRLESAVSGGSGYLAGSATARRVREAAFLPVQAPSEAQLRRELAAATAGSRDERGPGRSREE
jgi:alkylation response protein AidB-like acyl-CoA dehydrogenase